VDEEQPSRRQAWTEGPGASASGVHEWLALSDDDLLYRIGSLPADHSADDALLAIISSRRHFYIRMEAAKRVRETERMQGHWDDRHVGQILVRGLTRYEDIAYLEKLIAQSRYIEVRNAARAQLEILLEKINKPTGL
jgi:hypothetical protein